MGAEKIQPMIDKRKLAEMWGVSEDTIDTLVKTQGLPVYRFTSKIIRFKVSEVRQWEKERKVNG